MIVEDSNNKGLIINREQKIIITSFEEESVVYTSDDNEIWYGEEADFLSENPDFTKLQEEIY